MGFLTPDPTALRGRGVEAPPHLERIKPLAQDWALNGFGTPVAVYLLYVVKIALYAGRRAAADLGDDPGARRARQPRRLVDRSRSSSRRR